MVKQNDDLQVKDIFPLNTEMYEIKQKYFNGDITSVEYIEKLEYLILAHEYHNVNLCKSVIEKINSVNYAL